MFISTCCRCQKPRCVSFYLKVSQVVDKHLSKQEYRISLELAQAVFFLVYPLILIYLTCHWTYLNKRRVYIGHAEDGQLPRGLILRDDLLDGLLRVARLHAK